MQIPAAEIELFQFLTDYDFGDGYIDLHNDFNCVKLKLEDNALVLDFVSTTNDVHIFLKFQNVVLTVIEMDFVEKFEYLTITLLYRGRYQSGDTLIEFLNGRGYFYAEFCEGHQIEFWCENLSVERIAA